MLVLLSLLPQALADQEEQSRAEEECHSDQRACPTRTVGCSKPRCGVLPGCCEGGAGAGVRRRAMQQVQRSIPLIHEKAFCVAGAFLHTGNCLDTVTLRAGMALLHRAARDITEGEAAGLFVLNDNPRTAKKDAVAVLERAAGLAMREQAGSPVVEE